MSGCELAKIEDDRTVCGKGRLGDTQVLPRLLAIWEHLKKRPGYRFSYCSLGTYKGEQFFDAEQITRNKLCIYTKEKHTDFDRRFLMKRVGRRLEDRCCAGAAGRLTAHGL